VGSLGNKHESSRLRESPVRLSSLVLNESKEITLMSTRRPRTFLAVCVTLGAVAAVLSSPGVASLSNLSAASGGGATSATIKLVNLSEPGAPPSFGQQVTFVVSTTATAYPWVEVQCYQGGALVYDNSVGYFSSYMFPQVFTLGPTALWGGGAATCKASAISYGTRRMKVLGILSFGVSA
jgi:hypothetical protein